MKDVATSADMIADATGTTATKVAENAVPALKAMGQEAGDLGEHMDTFTFLARNSQMSVEDFSRLVQKARQFDDPQKRNAMDNLVSLCQFGCHQLADRMAPLYPFGDQSHG